MKKLFFIATFAFVSLAAPSAHAQSTISPVPGAPDRPHEPAPTVNANDQINGPRRSNDQQTAGTRTRYKTKKMSDGTMSPTDRKEDRKEMKMRKKADKAGNM